MVNSELSEVAIRFTLGSVVKPLQGSFRLCVCFHSKAPDGAIGLGWPAAASALVQQR